jgi:hypothetical protein
MFIQNREKLKSQCEGISLYRKLCVYTAEYKLIDSYNYL